MKHLQAVSCLLTKQEAGVQPLLFTIVNNKLGLENLQKKKSGLPEAVRVGCFLIFFFSFWQKKNV